MKAAMTPIRTKVRPYSRCMLSPRISPLRPVVSYRMLHPRICGDDEESRKPPSQPHCKTAAPQWPHRPRLFSQNKKVDSKKNENIPSIASVWPMTPPAAGRTTASSSELELNGDTGNDPDSEVVGEDLAPETGCVIVALVSSADRHRLEPRISRARLIVNCGNRL